MERGYCLGAGGKASWKRGHFYLRHPCRPHRRGIWECVWVDTALLEVAEPGPFPGRHQWP